jgi:hypothetical protein
MESLQIRGHGRSLEMAGVPRSADSEKCRSAIPRPHRRRLERARHPAPRRAWSLSLQRAEARHRRHLAAHARRHSPPPRARRADLAHGLPDQPAAGRVCPHRPRPLAPRPPRRVDGMGGHEPRADRGGAARVRRGRSDRAGGPMPCLPRTAPHQVGSSLRARPPTIASWSASSRSTHWGRRCRDIGLPSTPGRPHINAMGVRAFRTIDPPKRRGRSARPAEPRTARPRCPPRRAGSTPPPARAAGRAWS